MPTKTERILALLPGTFQASAGPSALRALADAFGSELLAGENSLAAVMRAHWVDHADKGAAGSSTSPASPPSGASPPGRTRTSRSSASTSSATSAPSSKAPPRCRASCG